MLEYQYDGTFPGLLTAIFDAFNRKEQPDAILRPGAQGLLFASVYAVETSEEKADRVWAGIKRVGGNTTCEHLYHAFLSLDEQVEMAIFRYSKHLFACNAPVMTDLAHPDVLKVHKLDRMVLREAHRVLMFLRFEQAADGTFFAPFAPQYDVIPLVTGHFKARFADQPWIIYDTKRGYGFYFNTQTIEQITIENPTFGSATGKLRQGTEHPDEDKWQELWRSYFKHISIAERKNLTLQRNFMPKRFWKYLTEKRL